ncbi:MAG: carboxypeptidase-like regulatory domain-containing protein [Marinifilaceae bacterium]
MRIRFFLSLIIVLISQLVYAQAERIRVQGSVRDQRKQPLAGVIIYNVATNEAIASTDDDGAFSFYVDINTKVRFESMGSEPQERVLKHMETLQITMKTDALKLDEVTIVAKVKKVIPEPTEIEVKGNYFHVRTRVRVPQELFRADTRLVIQTSLVSIADQKRDYMMPLVLDGEEYTIAQKRMYSFNRDRDPLSPYIYKSTSKNADEVIPFHDSLYIDDPKGDFRADVILTLEGYNKIMYRDSFAIARGLVNPLRFFQYNIASTDLTGEQYVPKPTPQLRNDKGQLKLTFLPNKVALDMSNQQTVAELDKLLSRLKHIESNPDAQLKSFVIKGTASPEGRYEQNKILAGKRLNNAIDIILSSVSGSTRKNMQVKTDADVESWNTVVKKMRADGATEADQLMKIISQNEKNVDRQSLLIAKLPFYRKLIVAKYLDELRFVNYEFDYSLFRVLTDKEITELYVKTPSDLSRYEYYRLFQCTNDTANLRSIYKKSLELYPKFALAANRLAVLNIKNNNPDTTVLAPFINEKAPTEILTNQVYTHLMCKQFVKADEISAYLPEMKETEEVRAVVATLNGDYTTYFDYIVSKGGLNEVLLLLVKKENEKALQKAKLLSNDVAVHNYVRAVAANRLDMIPEALNYMRVALSQDASLRGIAEVDGDVVDLIEIL